MYYSKVYIQLTKILKKMLHAWQPALLSFLWQGMRTSLCALCVKLHGLFLDYHFRHTGGLCFQWIFGYILMNFVFSMDIWKDTSLPRKQLFNGHFDTTDGFCVFNAVLDILVNFVFSMEFWIHTPLPRIQLFNGHFDTYRMTLCFQWTFGYKLFYPEYSLW